MISYDEKLNDLRILISRRIRQAEDVIKTRGNRYEARMFVGRPLGRP
jgi:hypothetical protein